MVDITVTMQVNWYLVDLGSWLQPASCMPAWSLSGRSHDSKAQDPRIYRSYSARICAPPWPRKSLTSCALCSAAFKTLVSFHGLLPSRDWPSRFRIVPKTKPTPPCGSSAFSRELQEQERSAEGHGRAASVRKPSDRHYPSYWAWQ
jgi:hypothetical protein